MADLTITKVNETWMRVECKEVYMELDIQDRFSFKVADAKFHPLVRASKWDGIKKLYNRKTKRMHCGLLYDVLSLADKKEWCVWTDPTLIPDSDSITTEELSELVSELIKPHDDGKPIEPYDYQLEAVEYMLNMDRSVCLAATSAGKSLILYLAIRLYQFMDELKGKTIFITVPSISLVEQLYSDFENYSTFDGSQWHVNQWCQKVSSKYPKAINKHVVITTWQSMEKLPYDVFEDIGAIFVDEVHTAKAKTLSKLIEQATSCPIRHGVTGTLDNVEVNELIIKGLLGPIKRIVSASDIIEQGRASPVEVKMVMLEHDSSSRKSLCTQKKKVTGKHRYQVELDYLNSMEKRRDFIYGMVSSLEGNTLVLFDRKESYGQQLYETYKELFPDTTFLITGDVSADEREKIRLGMEVQDKAVLWASYGTMSTGTSIKKLHNLVLISSSKSIIRVLQSIGRLMRKHSEKEKATIYDIVDNLTIEQEANYMLTHAQERIEFYSNEAFPISFMKLNI